eukprot:390232_1
MAPKTKKQADKAKAKNIEDKTFGLKNKNRSTKVQAFCAMTEKQIKTGNQADIKKRDAYDDVKKKKDAKKAFEAEMASLFQTTDEKPAKKPVPEEGDDDKNLGVDPEDYLWNADDFEEVEEDTERLEEKLEKER